jgi:hypothetical protein
MYYFSTLFEKKKLYVFLTDLPSIIMSLDTVFTQTGLFHPGTPSAVGSGRNISVRTSLAESQHTSMTNINCCEYCIKTPDDGR